MEILPNLPNDSKLWFYLSDTPLGADQLTITEKALQEFVSQWKAHGKQLAADYQILGNQALLIGVNEAAQEATGCSIDAQVHFIQALGQELGADFFNRHLLVVVKNEKASVISFEALAQGMENGLYTENTLVLDHLTTHLGTLRNGGVKPVAESWHVNLV